jgi:hypothetical protein
MCIHLTYPTCRPTSEGTDAAEMAQTWLEVQRLRTKVKKKVDTKASKGRKIRSVEQLRSMPRLSVSARALYPMRYKYGTVWSPQIHCDERAR